MLAGVGKLDWMARFHIVSLYNSLYDYDSDGREVGEKIWLVVVSQRGLNHNPLNQKLVGNKELRGILFLFIQGGKNYQWEKIQNPQTRKR